MGETAAFRPRSTGLAKADAEDRETDELGGEEAEELKEHSLQGCGERGENAEGVSVSRITEGRA